MSLSKELQIWGFEEGYLVFKDFSLGTILRLKARDISCATDEVLNALHNMECDFLNGLPSGVSLQFVQAIERGAEPVLSEHNALLKPNAEPLVSDLLAKRVEHILGLSEAGTLPRQALYLVVRKPFTKLKRKKTYFWQRKQEEDFNRDVLDPEIKSMSQLLASVTQGLSMLGIASEKLPEDESFRLMFDQWNPGYLVEPPPFNTEDIRDDLILSDMSVSLRGFALGNIYHRVLSLKIMPAETFASMSEKLRDLPFDSKLFLTIDVLDQGKETMALETQRRITYAMYAGKKGVSDMESEAKLKDIESLLAGRVSGKEKIFAVALNIVLRHESEEELENQAAAVLQTVRELSGAEGMLESLAAGPLFLDFALPHARAKERSRRMNTSVAADFLPLFGEWSGHAVPRVLLRNRRNGLLGFDPFSSTLTNFNQIISGGSGAGKSFLTNILVSHLVKEDPKVFILDIGGSYRRMTESLSGQYIALGANSNISLNPFDLSEATPEAVDQKIKFLVSLVELMTKEDESSGIGKLERSEIEQTIKEILRDEQEPRLTHLKERLLANKDVALQRMGKILGPWCGDSPFGKFVDQKTNLELSKRIVCFDLKGLESQPDLQAVCLFLITDFIWREVQRDRTSQKFVVFDECWSLLGNDAGARFIGEVFRTFRKYRASAIAISQTMDDFARSKVAAAILPNASIKWVLKQTGGNMASLKDILQMNAREVRLVESLTSKKGYYSEAFLIAGDDKQVVVVESTPLEYWLATTDPEDIKFMEKFKHENNLTEQADLLNKLAEAAPRGAGSSAGL